MAADIFAKIGDIKGESLDSKHKDEIEILSYSWGVSATSSGGAGGGAGAGKATIRDLSFVHQIDRSTPSLLRACATGEHLKEATITARKAGKGQQEFIVYKMSDIVVTSVSLGDNSQSGSEVVNLSFSKIEMEYRPQKADGSLDAGVHFKFDIKANKSF